MQVDKGGKAVCHFVTPIEDVFEDVKAMSNGLITDIQIPPF